MEKIKAGSKFIPRKDGYFLSITAMAELLANFKAEKRGVELKLKYEYEKKILMLDAEIQKQKSDNQALIQKNDINRVFCEKNIDIRDNMIKNVDWWKSPYFNFFLGTVVSGGFCVMTHVVK